jgi:Flp pilus assembly protein TadB
MWLPYKMFMTSALVIVALVGVATWSLLAIRRLVDVNRGIATRSLSALRMGTSLRPQGSRFLVRLPEDVAPTVRAASAGGER